MSDYNDSTDKGHSYSHVRSPSRGFAQNEHRAGHQFMQTRSGMLSPQKTAPPAVVMRRADGSVAAPPPFTGIRDDLATWAFRPHVPAAAPPASVQSRVVQRNECDDETGEEDRVCEAEEDRVCEAEEDRVCEAESVVDGAIVGASTLRQSPNTVPSGYAEKPVLTRSRHVLANLGGVAKSSGNSVLIQSISNAELLKLYREAATSGVKDGAVKLSNGQSWYINAKTGKFHPVAGRGIISLASYEFNILAEFKKSIGKKGAEVALQGLKKNLSHTGARISKDLQTGLEALARRNGISARRMLAAIQQNMTGLRNPPGKLADSARAISKGRAFRIVRYGGRTLLLVAIAADLYEVHEAKYNPKVITEKVGGWSGSLAAGAGTSKVASPLLAGGPWSWIAYGVIVAGASIGGYVVGETVVETVYEWGWEKN